MSGKVQVFRNGVSSGEVPAEVDERLLRCVRSASSAQHQTIAEVKSDSGKGEARRQGLGARDRQGRRQERPPAAAMRE